MRIMHLIATGKLRGAEMFAVDLINSLGSEIVSSLLVVLRSDEGIEFKLREPSSGPHELGSYGRGPVASVRRNLALRKLVGQWKPIVIQAHGGEALKHAVAAGLRRKIPLIYRRIGGAGPLISRPLRRALYSHLMKRCARVVTVSNSTKEESVEKFKLDAARVIAISNGVDPLRVAPSMGRSEARAALGVPADARVMLSLGALTWEKDPIGGLAVAERVLHDVPRAFYLIAGDGPLREELEHQILDKRLSERVRLTAPSNRVGDMYSAADLLLIHSRTEGVPGALIEAGMLAVPAAAYALGGVPEVLEHDETGLLADPGDGGALAEHARKLLSDAHRRHSMGQRARRAYRRFDIRNVTERYLELYRDVVAHR